MSHSPGLKIANSLCLWVGLCKFTFSCYRPKNMRHTKNHPKQTLHSLQLLLNNFFRKINNKKVSGNHQWSFKITRLTWFLSPNLSIYFNFGLCWGPLWYNHTMDFLCQKKSIYREVYVQYLHYIIQYLYYITPTGILINLENGVQLLLALNEHNCL